MLSTEELLNKLLYDRLIERTWTKLDGTKLSLYAMSILHIDNSIKMIERAEEPAKAAYGFGEEWLNVFYTELHLRGDKNKSPLERASDQRKDPPDGFMYKENE